MRQNGYEFAEGMQALRGLNPVNQIRDNFGSVQGGVSADPPVRPMLRRPLLPWLPRWLRQRPRLKAFSRLLHLSPQPMARLLRRL
jgi:hypothetical protein